MADARNRAEAQHHFLIYVQDGDQQQQCPQKVCPVILAGLGIRAESAGVVVAHHDNEARPDNGKQSLQLGGEAGPDSNVLPANSPECSVDVAYMGGVDNCGVENCGVEDCGVVQDAF